MMAVVFGLSPRTLCSHQNLMLIEQHPKAACNERNTHKMSMAWQSEAMSWRLGLQQRKGLKSPLLGQEGSEERRKFRSAVSTSRCKSKLLGHNNKGQR